MASSAWAKSFNNRYASLSIADHRLALQILNEAKAKYPMLVLSLAQNSNGTFSLSLVTDNGTVGSEKTTDVTQYDAKHVAESIAPLLQEILG